MDGEIFAVVSLVPAGLVIQPGRHPSGSHLEFIWTGHTDSENSAAPRTGVAADTAVGEILGFDRRMSLRNLKISLSIDTRQLRLSGGNQDRGPTWSAITSGLRSILFGQLRSMGIRRAVGGASWAMPTVTVRIPSV